MTVTDNQARVKLDGGLFSDTKEHVRSVYTSGLPKEGHHATTDN